MFRAGRGKFSEGIKGEVWWDTGAKLPIIYREQKGPPRGSGTPLGACQTMKTSGYARPLAYPLVFGLTRELFKVSVRP